MRGVLQAIEVAVMCIYALDVICVLGAAVLIGASGIRRRE